MKNTSILIESCTWLYWEGKRRFMTSCCRDFPHGVSAPHFVFGCGGGWVGFETQAAGNLFSINIALLQDGRKVGLH